MSPAVSSAALLPSCSLSLKKRKRNRQKERWKSIEKRIRKDLAKAPQWIQGRRSPPFLAFIGEKISRHSSSQERRSFPWDLRADFCSGQLAGFLLLLEARIVPPVCLSSSHCCSGCAHSLRCLVASSLVVRWSGFDFVREL